MKRVETGLPGVLIIEPVVYGDGRGQFFELWNSARYRELGVPGPWVQDNVSFSRRDTLRGLHFQYPNGQGKLVTVLEGAVYDVAVDVRAGSATFGQWTSVELNSENRRQMYVPPGFAHGFVVTSESALFHYKCTGYYEPASERSIRWDDPDLRIPWPVTHPTLSRKDSAALFLKDLDRTSLPPLD